MNQAKLKKYLLILMSLGLLLIVFGFANSASALSPPPPRSHLWKFFRAKNWTDIKGDVYAKNNITIEGSATGVVSSATNDASQIKLASSLNKIAPYTLSANSDADWTKSFSVHQTILNRLKNERAKPINDILQIPAGKINKDDSPEGGIWYYDGGDLTLSNDPLFGRGTIIVGESGNLNINQDLNSGGDNDIIGFIVPNGDVRINSNAQNLKIAVYAPNGNIVIDSTSSRSSIISGLLVAESIQILRRNIEINYNPQIRGGYEITESKYFLSLPGFSQIVSPKWSEVL